jgi:hypothetical protein
MIILFLREKNMRNSDYKRFIEAFSDLEKNHHNIEFLVEKLDVNIHFKQCLYDVVKLVKDCVEDGNSVGQLKLISNVISQVLYYSDDVNEKITNDPINFNYAQALDASRDIKYKIAKEIRDYV